MTFSRPFTIDQKKKTETQQRLIDTENDIIDKLNEDSTVKERKKTILDQSLNDIFDDYTKSMANVIDEVVNAVNDPDLPDNARTHSYIGILIQYILTIFNTITKPENIIYSGITLIFISIFIYYIFVVG